MNEFNYPSNANVDKAAQKEAATTKPVQKVVKGTVKTKPNEVRKLTDIFISEDASKVKNYIVMDVLVPAIKKAISDIVRNGIDMILYGEAGRDKKKTNGDYVSYRNYSEDDRYRNANVTRGGFSYDDLYFAYRGDAERVLMQLQDAIRTYGLVSIGELYDLAGISNDNYMNHKYGWMNLGNAEIVSTSRGYLLKLPKAVPLG